MDGVSGILEVRDILYGDVNGDGKIASVDLAMLRKYIASVDPITGVSTVAVKAGADCNGDGKVNSVDLAMLPIFVFCVRWGFGPGILVSAAHAILQTLFEGGIAIGWQSIIGDFLLAYTILGVAGLFRKTKGGFFWGTFVGCAARFLVHYVVGATIWAEYMPEQFFGMTMTTPWFYSFLYNIAYMGMDCILILLVGFLLCKTPAASYLKPAK